MTNIFAKKIGISKYEELAKVRFNRILDEMDDEAFVRVYRKVLEFFKPKLARIEGTVLEQSTVKTIMISPASQG